MEKDLDNKLYNDYLSGEKQAFEYLYNKYKKKIEYFIFNIVKDYQKAEDITQETFIYIMQNPIKENISFKYNIYLVARSKAYNYINVEKRRTEINEKYIFNADDKVDKDVLEIITEEENKKELLKSIDELDEKYRNAIYLVNIEGLSYEETSKILGQTLSNTKNLIHRGKKQLRKILLKNGFDEMNKVAKTLIIIICTGIILSGVVYAGIIIYNNYVQNNTNHNITMNPTYQSTLDDNTINNLWIGTLDLAWKELESELGKTKIDLEEGNIPIVDALNSSIFTKQMLDSKDYNITVEKNYTGGYNINATLNKELNFLEPFDNFSNYLTQKTFANGGNYIKYFGINNASPETMNQNIEVLFYNKIDDTSLLSNDFAIKLKTQEGDEIILYRTNDNKNFNEYYTDIKEKTNNYTGDKKFNEDDELRIPYVRVNGVIAYNELYEKYIKDTDGMYFSDVIQNVNFSLNEKGCNLTSAVTLITETLGVGLDTKFCYFEDQFIIFMKETNSDNPYFTLKVDNDDILEKIDEIDEPKIIDYTVVNPERCKQYLDNIEYKFYEDNNFEYYYSSRKTWAVQVFFKDGSIDTVEYALKNGKITMDLLDKSENIKKLKKEL